MSEQLLSYHNDASTKEHYLASARHTAYSNLYVPQAPYTVLPQVGRTTPMTPTLDTPVFYLIRDTASAEDGWRYATLATEPDAHTMSGGIASSERIPPSRARRPRLGVPTQQRPYGHLPDNDEVGCECECHETSGPVYEDLGDACRVCLPTHTPDTPVFYLIRDTASAEDGYRYATLATEPDARTMSGGIASSERIPPSRARRMAEAAEDCYSESSSPFPRRGYHLFVTSEAAHALGIYCEDLACPECP